MTKRVLPCIPEAEKRNVQELKKLLRSMPGVIAVPNTKAPDANLSDNVIYEEDFSSTTAFYNWFQMNVPIREEFNKIPWTENEQNNFIAIMFGLCYMSMPVSPNQAGNVYNEVAIMTEEQAKIFSEIDQQKRFIVGPAGSGKTWTMLQSIAQNQRDLLKKHKGNKKILVLCQNKAPQEFIKSCLSQPSSTSLPIEVHTKCGLIEYMVMTIIGKRRASLKHKLQQFSKPTALERCKEELDELELHNSMYKNGDDNERYEKGLSIVENYRKDVTPKTFAEIQYNSVFIDEGQDFYPRDLELIESLIKKSSSSSKRSSWKLWIFGDHLQCLYNFKSKDRKQYSILHQAIENGECTSMNKIVRSHEKIFEEYHPFLHNTFDEDESNSSCSSSESENDCSLDDGKASEVSDNFCPLTLNSPCSICKSIPPRVAGSDVITARLKETESLSKMVVSYLIDLLELGDENTLADCAILDGRHQSSSELDKFKQEFKKELIERGKRTQIRKSNLNLINAEEFAKGSKKLLGKRKSDANTSIRKKNLVLDTVRKFKGLEAKCVFLILKESDRLITDSHEYDSIVYCGMSRAISLLYIFHC